MENYMSNNITTLNEKDLFEIIQRQQLETIERQAREITHLENRLKIVVKAKAMDIEFGRAEFMGEEWDIDKFNEKFNSEWIANEWRRT
jgi:hypothetical protein